MTGLAALWDMLAAWLAYRWRHRASEDWWAEMMDASRPPWER